MVMKIKALREAKHISQADLANSMGVFQSAVSNWESEVALPRSRDLPLLAKVLGCEINELFVQDGAETEPQ